MKKLITFGLLILITCVLSNCNPSSTTNVTSTGGGATANSGTDNSQKPPG